MSNASNRELYDLKEMAPKIATALGIGWTVSPETNGDPTDWRAILNGPDGQKLWLSTTWGSKGMLHIAGIFPNGPGGQSYKPYKSNEDREKYSIQANFNKTPEQIARDIQRRLLPTYREALTEALNRKRSDEQAEIELEAFAAEIAALIGQPAPKKGDCGYHLYFDGGPSFSIEHGPQVRFDHLYLDPEMARRILPILAEVK
jgi:hypothetical protein